jgi:uncharacterized membrane protein YkoI
MEENFLIVLLVVRRRRFMKIASKITFFLANVALVVIIAIGVLTAFAQAQDDAVDLTEANVARSDALVIAETEADSAAVSIELERENGRLIYSIHTANGQEINVDATDGSLVSVEPPHNHCEDEDETALGAPTITLLEAMTAAESEGGSPAVGAEVENEDGVLVYSVDLNDGLEININAMDGTIVSVEEADDDEDVDDLDETSGLDDDNESSGADDIDGDDESSGSGECLDSEDDGLSAAAENESSGSDDSDDESSGAHHDDDNESSGSGE